MKLLSRASFYLLLACSAAYAGRTNQEIDVTVTAAGTPSITSLTFPSSPSFSGGATDGTTVASITVTTSDSSTPTMSLTGTQTGSGNDADSFQIGAGPALLIHTAGGATDQPGVYSICIIASGSYSNSPQQACGTVQATGPGGAGWQLGFSDEFVCPNNMLECLATYSVTSYTWANSACANTPSGAAGCGTMITSSAVTALTNAGCTGNRLGSCAISVVGATNSGSGGNSIVNGTFLVVGVSSDQKTLTLYMPYSGITSPMGGTTTVGTGPWVVTIVLSSGSPNANPTMLWTNNASEGWDAHAVSVDASGLAITTTNTAFTDPLGSAHTYTSGHVQTWGGTSGFAQALGNGVALDFYGQPATSGTPTGIWATYWSLGNDNSWPGTSANGGEIDVAEFASASCAYNQYDMNAVGSTTGLQEFTSGTSGTYIGTSHQFTATHVGSTVTWYRDGGVLPNTAVTYAPTDPFYPIVDVEYPSGCGAHAVLPITTRARYVRVYSKVTSGACYSAIPAHGTVPHTGGC